MEDDPLAHVVGFEIGATLLVSRNLKIQHAYILPGHPTTLTQYARVRLALQ